MFKSFTTKVKIPDKSSNWTQIELKYGREIIDIPIRDSWGHMAMARFTVENFKMVYIFGILETSGKQPVHLLLLPVHGAMNHSGTLL